MKTLAKFALVALLAASGLLGCTQESRQRTSDDPSPNTVTYVASISRQPFHRPGCKWAQRISAANLQTFTTRGEAIRAGHRPCKVLDCSILSAEPPAAVSAG